MAVIQGGKVEEQTDYIGPQKVYRRDEVNEKRRIFAQVRESVRTMSGNSVDVFTNNERPSRENKVKVECEAVISRRRGSFHRLRPDEVMEIQGL